MKIIGVLVGFGGIVLMFSSVPMGDGGSLLGQISVLCAALSYACAGVFGRRFGRMGVNPIIVAAGQVTVSSVILVPMAAISAGRLYGARH